MSDRPQTMPILLTRLLTTNLDQRGQRWNARSPCNVPAARMDNDGQNWTNLILLRIRRLGVRVPPSAPDQPSET